MTPSADKLRPATAEDGAETEHNSATNGSSDKYPTVAPASGDVRSDCTLALPGAASAVGPVFNRPGQTGRLETGPTLDQTLALPDEPAALAPGAGRLDQTLQEPAEFSRPPTHPAQEHDTAPLTAGASLVSVQPPDTRHLQHSDQAGLTWMPSTDAVTPPDVRVQRTVAPGYEVLGELGRGGMGVVYKARQLRLNRLVALKMIRAGAQAGSEDLRRFRIEAEAVACLQHPNIVQIYEIGEEDGLPFFSLEFVDGGSLLQHLDKDTGLPARQAAVLVETLARAMHYAHSRGIVHRDLKPANILLASGGRKPPDSAAEPGGSHPPLSQCTPKITDFGLAKHLEKDTTQTREGSILGTPSYMAPEQAEGRNKDIGPATDIYSLGAILYDLLASRPPFRGETVMDTLQLVINAEPLPPTQLQPGLARDLETICLKCLQKDTKKRYLTAEALADDLRRFLDGEPILARATPTWEKAVKWCRRRPARASLLLFGVLAVLGLVIGSNLYARQERRRADTEAGLHREADAQRRRADDKAEEERRQRQRADAAAQEAERQRVIAVRQSNRAQRRFRDAVAAVDSLLIQTADQRLENVPQFQEVRRALLQDALRFYRLYLLDKSGDRALREENGFTQRRIANIHERLGDLRQAEAARREALALFTGLLADNPTNLVYQRNVGVAWNDLGIILQANKDHSGAVQAFDKAVALLGSTRRGYPDPPGQQSLLAGALLSPLQPAGLRWNTIWQMVAAETTIQTANVCTGLLADAHLHRGNLRLALGQEKEAGDDLRAAQALYEPLHRQAPGQDEFRSNLASATSGLATLLLRRDPKKATTVFDRAVVLLKPLAEHSGAAAKHREQLALVQRNRGVARFVSGAPGTNETQRLVEKDLRDAAALLAPLARDYQAVPEYRVQLADVHVTLAIFYRQTGRPGAAAAAWLDVIAARTSLARQFPDQPEHRAQLAVAHGQRAQLLVSNRVAKVNEAVAEWQKAIDLQTKLVADQPKERDSWAKLAATYVDRIALWKSQARAAEAEKDYRALTAVLAERCQVFPGEATYLADLAVIRVRWAEVLRERGRDQDADARLQEAVAAQRQAVAKEPANIGHRRALCAYEVAAGDYAGAAENAAEGTVWEISVALTKKR